jgi:hypothetical protein
LKLAGDNTGGGYRLRSVNNNGLAEKLADRFMEMEIGIRGLGQKFHKEGMISRQSD